MIDFISFFLYIEGYGSLRIIVAREWLIDSYDLARRTIHPNLNNRPLLRLPTAYERRTGKIRDDTGGEIAYFGTIYRGVLSWR